MPTTVLSHKTCEICDGNSFVPSDAEQFSVERPGQCMVIGNVPGFVCMQCSHTSFDESVVSELIAKTLALFQKQPLMRMFAYQFTDFVRPQAKHNFPPFTKVRIRDGVDVWDLYDERLRAGMCGHILGEGINPFDYRVTFLIRKTEVEVEIDVDDLELAE